MQRIGRNPELTLGPCADARHDSAQLVGMDKPAYNPTTFREFFLSLPKEQRARFADIAGTTEQYISVKLVRAVAVPRPQQMERLWRACKAYRAPFTRADLLQFFYPEAERAE